MTAPGGKRGTHAAVFAALALAHLGLCAYFAPFSLLDDAVPPLNDAFAIGVYRAARARLAGPGAFVTFDPQVLAGQIAGLAEPLSGRALGFAVLGLGALGVAPVRAFGAALLALHAAFPFIGYAAARAFGLRPAAALVAFALWSYGWFFDSLVHYSWYSGRIEWTVGSGAALCAAGLAWRLSTSGGVVRGALAVAAVLAAATVVAPLPALFVVAFALGPLAATHGLLGPRRLGVAAPAIVTLSLVLFVFAREGAISSEPLAVVYRASFLEPLWDALEIPGSGNGAPGAARTLVRTLCFTGAVLQLAALRAVGDSRRAPLGGVSVGGLLLGYAGGFVPVAWPVDPYFFLVPAWLGASLLTAELLTDLSITSLVRGGPPAFRLGLGLAALVFVPRLVRSFATYVPELLPRRVERAALDYKVSALVGLNEPLPEPLRHAPPPPQYAALAASLEQHAADRGRIVVDDPALAAFLAIRTSLPVLGPVAQRGAASSDADPTRFLEGPVDDRELAAYLERYAAGFIVLVGPESAFDRSASGVLEPAVVVFGARVRRVREEPRWFVEGGGRVVQARAGQIRVFAEPARRVILRFHYDERLECRPSCATFRAAVPGDRAGFIGVLAPPPEFELVRR